MGWLQNFTKWLSSAARNAPKPTRQVAAGVAGAFNLGMDLVRYHDANRRPAQQGFWDYVGQSWGEFSDNTVAGNVNQASNQARLGLGAALNAAMQPIEWSQRAATAAALVTNPKYVNSGDWSASWRDADQDWTGGGANRQTTFGNALVANDSFRRGMASINMSSDPLRASGYTELTPAGSTLSATQLSDAVAKDRNAQFMAGALNITAEFLLDPYLVGGKLFKLGRLNLLDQPLSRTPNANAAVPERSSWIEQRTGINPNAADDILTQDARDAIAKADAAYTRRYGGGMSTQERTNRAAEWLEASRQEGTGANVMVNSLTDMSNVDEVLQSPIFTRKGWVTGERGALAAALANTRNAEETRTVLAIAMGEESTMLRQEVGRTRLLRTAGEGDANLQAAAADARELLANLRPSTQEIVLRQAADDSLLGLNKGLFDANGVPILPDYDDPQFMGRMRLLFDDHMSDPVVQNFLSEYNAKIIRETKLLEYDAQLGQQNNLLTGYAGSLNYAGSRFGVVESMRAARGARRARRAINDQEVRGETAPGRWVSAVYRASGISRPLRVVTWLGQKMPPGRVSISGPQAGTSVESMMQFLNSSSMYARRSYRTADGLNGVQRKRELLAMVANAAPTDTARRDAIGAVERAVMEDTARWYGVDPTVGGDLYKMYSGNRTKVENSLRENGFAYINGEIVTGATLTTQLENSLQLVDVPRYEALMQRHASTLHAFGREITNPVVTGMLRTVRGGVGGTAEAATDISAGAQAWNKYLSAGGVKDRAYALYTMFESIWKPAVLVLGRLGYMVRNNVESNLRAFMFMGRMASMNMTDSVVRSLDNARSSWFVGMGNTVMGRGRNGYRSWNTRKLRADGVSLEEAAMVARDTAERLGRDADLFDGIANGIEAGGSPIPGKVRFYRGDVDPITLYHGTNLSDAEKMTEGGRNVFDWDAARTSKTPGRMPGLSVAYAGDDYRVEAAKVSADSKARVRYGDDLARRERDNRDALDLVMDDDPNYARLKAEEDALRSERAWFEANQFEETLDSPFYAQAARVVYEVRPRNPQYQKLNPSTGPTGQPDEGVDFVYGPIDYGDVAKFDPNSKFYTGQEGLVVDPNIARPVRIERWIPEKPGSQRGEWVTVKEFGDDGAADGGPTRERWFTTSREEAERYAGVNGRVSYVDVDEADAQDFMARNLDPDTAAFASNADTDAFLPVAYGRSKQLAPTPEELADAAAKRRAEAARKRAESEDLWKTYHSVASQRDDVADRLQVEQFIANNSRLTPKRRRILRKELEARQARLRDLQMRRDEFDPNGEVFTYNPAWADDVSFTKHGLVPNPDDPRYPAIAPRGVFEDGTLVKDDLSPEEVKDYMAKYEDWLRVATEHDNRVLDAVRSGTMSVDEASAYLRAPSVAFDPSGRDDLLRRHNEAADEAIRLDAEADGYDELLGVALDKMGAIQKEMALYDRSLLNAVMRGEIDFADAKKYSLAGENRQVEDWFGFSEEILFDYRPYNPDGDVPPPLPDEMWHATTNLPGVQSQGLKSADDLGFVGNRGSAGLGGSSKYASVGTSRKAAEQVAAAHRLVARIARGEVDAKKLVEMSDRQGWYLSGYVNGKGGVFYIVDPKTGRFQEVKDWARTNGVEGRITSEMFVPLLQNTLDALDSNPQWASDVIRGIMRAYGRHKNHLDPYYASFDWNVWKNVNPDDIGVAKISPEVPLRGRPHGGDAAAGEGTEYRLPPTDNLRIDDLPTPREQMVQGVADEGLAEREALIAQLAELDDQIWRSQASTQRLAGLVTNKRVWNNSGVITVNGWAIPDAYAGPNGEVARKEASSAGTWERMTMDTTEAAYRSVSSDALVNYGKLTRGDGAAYWNGLTQVINSQLRLDPLVRKIFEGATRDDLVTWAMSTAQGRAYVKRMGAANTRKDAATGVETNPYNGLRYLDDVMDWVDDHITMVTDYTGDSRALWSLLLDGPVDQRTMINLLEESPAGAPATIVGPIDDGSGAIANALKAEGRTGKHGAATLGQWWDGFTSWLFKWIGTIPEDKFARHPFYAQAYRQKAMEMVEVTVARREAALEPGDVLQLSRPDVMDISTKAHQYALATLKNTLYTLEQTSNFSGMLRFVSPFVAAWENSIMTWARLGYEDPARLAMIEKAWNLPNDMSNAAQNDSDTADALANTVGVVQVGRYVNGQWEPTTDARGLGSDQVLRFQLPRWLVDNDAKFAPWRALGFDSAPFASLDGTPFEVRKASLNMVFQGENPLNPGFAPYITIPAAEVLKRRPDLYQNVTVTINGEQQTLPGLRTIVPFGPDESPTPFAALLPPVVTKVKRAIGAQFFNDREVWDSVFLYHVQTETKNMVTDYELGKRATMPTPEEAIDRAKKRAWLDAVVSMVAPAAVKTISPYQFYIDEYRKLIAADWRTAEDKFRELHGEEFMAFAESGSQTDTRIAPTVASYENLEKLKRDNPELVKALLTTNPAMLGELVNEDGAPFDSAVYRYQMDRPVTTGSDVTMRERKTPEELLADIDKGKVWERYNLYSAQYDQEIARRKAEADAAGVYYSTSKSAVENADLKEWWDGEVIPGLRAESEAWFADWEDKDETRLRRTLDAAQSVVTDQNFMSEQSGDPFYGALQTYMVQRQELSNEIARREWIYKSQVLPELERDNYGRLKKSDRTKYTFGLGDWENEDLQIWWGEVVWSLKSSSPQFAQFYDYNLSRDFWVYTQDTNTGYIEPYSLVGAR